LDRDKDLDFADCKTRFSGGGNVDLVKGVDLIEKEKKRRKKTHFFSSRRFNFFLCHWRRFEEV